MLFSYTYCIWHSDIDLTYLIAFAVPKMGIRCVPHARLECTTVALPVDKSLEISGVWHWRK